MLCKKRSIFVAILPVDNNQRAVVVDEKCRKETKVCQTLMLEEAISVLLLVEAAGDCETRGAVSENVTLQESTGAAIQVLPFLLINKDLQHILLSCAFCGAWHRWPSPVSVVWISAQWVDVGLYSRDLP